MIALSKLFSLNDARLAQTMVKGDLIINNNSDGKILTRSRARQSMFFFTDMDDMAARHAGWSVDQDEVLADLKRRKDPDQYTIIPSTLKILKVLIEELLSASGANNAASIAAAAAAAAGEFADEENDDDGWEDDPDALDLSLGTTKADLMQYLDGSGTRQRDDETQAYLTEFFLKAARENVAGFQDWYSMLTQEEREKLNELASAAGQ